MMKKESRETGYFQSKSDDKNFYKKNFYNSFTATNISIWEYLANKLFDGDLNRVVWSTSELMFRRRQEQVAAQQAKGIRTNDVGILDFPFVAFRLSQDGVQDGFERQWKNQALNVEGMWVEELGRKVRMTPATFNYEAVFVCHTDYDLYFAQHSLVWDESNETLLSSHLESKGEDGLPHTIRNIIVCGTKGHLGATFQESDWLSKNRIQAIPIDLLCGTYLLGDDRHQYSITKNVVLNFTSKLGFHYDQMKGDLNRDPEEVVWNIFNNTPVYPYHVPPAEDSSLSEPIASEDLF